LAAKLIQHLVQNFDFSKKDACPFTLDRTKNEGILQIPVAVDPNAALRKPFLGKRELIRIVARLLRGNHGSSPPMLWGS
jgi:hypothetical protein